MPAVDLARSGRYHVVGAGGPGMSAIAQVLVEMGHEVTASDLRDTPVLDRLRAAGVTVWIGHDRSHVDGAHAVTASTAVPPRNLELVAAAEAGVTVLSRAGMLAAICAQARAVAVAGTHGKTTTTSMLMLMLAGAGWKPSFVIGGDVAEVGTGAHWSGGGWLVVEADESDGTHLELPLYGTILTNVETDHLDHYGTFEAIVAGFRTYLEGIAGPKVLCADDVVCASLAAAVPGTITYGTVEGARYRATGIEAVRGALRFQVEHGATVLGTVDLPLRGRHNVLNACGAIAMAIELGVPFADAVDALARFGGVARRFDIRGYVRGATLVDDYAHLPTEIDAVLTAARTSGDDWSRVVAVFQPNRYNRMSVLSPEYRDAFVAADLIVLTDIYASGTTPIPGVTGKLVVDAVLDAHPDAHVVWLPKRDDLIDYLARNLRAGDVCISMGCGDVAMLPDEVLDRARQLDAVAAP